MGEFNIETVKENVLKYCPALAQVFKGVRFGLQSGGTAAADSKEITYNAEFMKGLSPEKQAFVIAHEGLHIYFGHVFGPDDVYEDIEVLDRAYDAYINSYLVEKVGMAAPSNIIRIDGACNVSIKEIYDRLMQEKKAGRKVQNVKAIDDKPKKNEKEPGREDGEGVYMPGSHERFEREVQKQFETEAQKQERRSKNGLFGTRSKGGLER